MAKRKTTTKILQGGKMNCILLEDIEEEMNKSLLTFSEIKRVENALKYKSYPFIKIIKKLRRQEELFMKINKTNKLDKHLKKLNGIRKGVEGDKILKIDCLKTLNKFNKISIINEIVIPKIILDDKRRNR